ncbi:MAG: hypothetical protein SGILL_005598, partial [Bacillariaceae sp.]
MGIMCNTGIRGYEGDSCSWVQRLDLLLNFDYDTGRRYSEENNRLFEIHSTAVGGWNTYVSNAVLEYDLISSDEWLNPDIIINAHATNEMHVNTMREAVLHNQTHWDYVFDMTQRFIRTVLLKKCMIPQPISQQEQQQQQQRSSQDTFNEPPLLIYFDDYLGNDQRSILDTTIASQSIHILAKYYGIGYVSYADVVRDIVLRDTTETVFSPQQWYKAESGNQMLRE